MQFSLCQRIGEYPEEGMTLHHKGHHEVEGFRVSRFLHCICITVLCSESVVRVVTYFVRLGDSRLLL